MSVTFKVQKSFLIITVAIIIAISVSLYAIGVALDNKNSKDVPILMYHSIIKDESKWNDYVLSPVQLEEDFIWLKEKGISLSLSATL
ncbi:MAG: hypothetical protein IJU04_06295 [Ruminococcus sp.]|nr:hypothetical protein [Ruminococcus sp.]